MIRRGDIRWFRFSIPDKRRPVLVVSPDDQIPQLSQIIVIPLSSRLRGLESEVVLGPEDGLPQRSALKPGWIKSIEKCEVGAFISTLPEGRWNEVRRAILRALGFPE